MPYDSLYWWNRTEPQESFWRTQANHSWVPCGISALFKSNFIHDSEYMKIHIFELRKKQWINERSSQLHTQLKQLRKLSLKKNSGLNGIRTHDLCDTSAALLTIELSTGSWSFSEFYIYPLRWWNHSEYRKIHIFELRKKQWISERSSQLYTQLKQLRKLSLKNGIRSALLARSSSHLRTCLGYFNGFLPRWRRVMYPKRLWFFKDSDTFWYLFYINWSNQ